MLSLANNQKLSCIEAFFFVSHNSYVTQICPKREVCNFFETKQSILLVEKLPGSPTKGCVVFKIMLYQQEISIVYSLLFLIWRSEWKSPLYWIKVISLNTTFIKIIFTMWLWENAGHVVNSDTWAWFLSLRKKIHLIILITERSGST